MNIDIVLLTGESLHFQVNKNSCVFGRSSQCDVVIPHEAMSRKHCLLEVKNGEFFVTDLDSSNGIFIEGTKIFPNIPTPYQTFFSLSFGAAQSVLISLETNQSIASRTDPKSSTTPHLVKSNRSNFIKTVYLANKKDKEGSKLPNLVALIIALAFLGYYFTQVRPL
jgi:pSer/pThr/pTyr-binding forkhead associated (FHA) protein